MEWVIHFDTCGESEHIVSFSEKSAETTRTCAREWAGLPDSKGHDVATRLLTRCPTSDFPSSYGYHRKCY